jgi:dihydrolipoamide dehydrogenase
MQEISVDVAILGAGTAGLNARRGAERAGSRALMIDPGPLGTTCARVGCMPSKLLIAAAEAVHQSQTGDIFGFTAEVKVDGPRVLERVRRERDRFVGFVKRATDDHAKHDRLLDGRGRVTGPNQLVVERDGVPVATVHFRTLVVATGSSPIIPPLFRDISDRVLTSDEIFELPDLPKSLLVLGPGVIGLELGQAMNRLGVDVTIVGRSGKVGPLQDPQMQAKARAIYTEELDLHASHILHSVERVDDGVKVEFTGASGRRHSRTYEYVLSAVGRRANTRGLGLENAGVKFSEDGRLPVNLYTAQVGDTAVFMAGDAAALRPLLHEAADEGQIAGANAATWPEVSNHKRRTELAIVFTDPQMAVVGQTWDMHGCDDHRVGDIDYSDQGRARTMAKNKGWVRIYGEVGTGLVTGAEMIGPGVEHTAHLLAWAVQKRLTVSELLDMPFYHPVVEEGIRTALQDLFRNMRTMRGPGEQCDEFAIGA